MTEPLPLLAAIAPQTCLCFPEGEGCVCLDSERACRAYAYPLPEMPMPPMTPVQREECLAEIATVEGYERTDYDACTDQDLAHGVLSAWQSYCRDKGLL